MATSSDLERILADLRKNRETIEETLRDQNGIESTAGILEKLKELRRRAEETNALIEVVERRQDPR